MGWWRVFELELKGPGTTRVSLETLINQGPVADP
jgi:hypothetical protein